MAGAVALQIEIDETQANRQADAEKNQADIHERFERAIDDKNPQNRHDGVADIGGDAFH